MSECFSAVIHRANYGGELYSFYVLITRTKISQLLVRLQARRFDVKQAGKVFSGDLRQFIHRNTFQYGHIFCNVTHHGWLVFFTRCGTGARYGESVSPISDPAVHNGQHLVAAQHYGRSQYRKKRCKNLDPATYLPFLCPL